MMKDYKTVGFDAKKEGDDEEDFQASIPKQVQQFYMEVPTQYRLIYLLMFLYAHQGEKVIIFASNCETVNLIFKIMKELNWNLCVNRRG